MCLTAALSRKLVCGNEEIIETAERTIKIPFYVATHQFLFASGPLKCLIFSVNDVLLLLYAVHVPVLAFPVPVSNTQIHGSTPGGMRYPLVTLYRLIPFNDHACLSCT
jgi:hypothetical protein